MASFSTDRNNSSTIDWTAREQYKTYRYRVAIAKIIVRNIMRAMFHSATPNSKDRW